VRAVALLALTLAGLAAPAAATAAFPGRPGAVVFQQVRNAASRLATVDPVTGAVRVLPIPGDAFNPAWSPRGTRIAFTGAGAQLLLARPDGRGARALTAPAGGDAGDDDPAWAPNGRRLAFQSTRNRLGGAADVWLVNLDGSRLRPFLTGPAADGQPAFSPDGRRLAFTSDRDGDADVYLVRPSGADLVQLTRNRATDSEPAWSPDGRRIAFVSDRSGHSQLYVMGARGTHARRLTRSPLLDQSPAWSPDGRRIVFSRGPDVVRDPRAGGTFDLFVVPATGGPARPLVQSPADDLSPDWQARPR
jgi:TolB protein